MESRRMLQRSLSGAVMAAKSTERVKAFRLRNRWYRPLEYAKRRCTDPKHKEYHRYGGRGIVCTLTREEAIYIYKRDNGDLLERPSLDRIDPEGNYSFENCRFIEWIDNVTKKFQSKNNNDEWEE